MTDTTDPQTAEPGLCPNCQHPEHGIGIECEHRVEHDGQRHWHVCLCLNRPGASRPCSPLMTCQGGRLGYADVWYLQRGQRLQSADGGVIKPDVLLAAEEAAAAPPVPADRAGLRERIAAAIYEHMHPGSHWSDTSMPTDWRPAYLDEADAVLSVLPSAADRAASYRLAADAIESMQGYPHLILPEEIVAGLRLLAAGEQPESGSPAYIRRLAAGERDEQQAQQGGHSCGNCEGIDPSTCLTNPDRDPNAPDAPCPTPESHNWGCGCPSDVAAAIASCPGRETDGPSPCRCPCEGCKHNCGAHAPAAAPVAGQPPADTGEEAQS